MTDNTFRITPPFGQSIRHAAFVVVGYSVFFLIFFAPVVFSGNVLAPGDGISYFLPNFYQRTLLWDTSIWGGFPALGDAPRMFWYPPAFLLGRLRLGFDLFIVSAYVLAASFTYGYTFSLTRSRLAGIVSGLIYGLCGFMIAHIGHAAVVHTTAWLPLIVWSYFELANRRRFSRIWFVIGSIAVACAALAGHPQMFSYVVLLSGVFALVVGLKAPMTRWRYYLVCVLTLLVGVGLAAIQLVPTMELAPYTARASLTFEEFVAYQLPLRQLPMIIFPFLYGGSPGSFYATPYFGAWPSSADGWGASELSGYVGLLPLVLACLGYLLNRRNRIAWFWSAVAVVALMLVVGESTPLARLTYHLPVLNKFRAPARYFFAFGFAISVLSAMGISVLQNGAAAKRLLIRTLLIAGAVMVVSLVLLQQFAGKINELALQRLGQGIVLNPVRNASLFVPALLLVIGGVVLLLWCRGPKSRLRTTLLVLVIVVDLSSFAWFYEWRYRSPSRAFLHAPAAANNYRKQVDESHQRVLPVRGGLGQVSELPPDLSKLWQIPSATGYGPFILTRLSRLLTMPPHGSVDGAWSEPGNQSLDLLGVRYVLLPATEPKAALVTDERGLRWSARDFNVTIGSGCTSTTPLSTELELPLPRRATRMGIVGALACSVELPNAVEFAQLTIINTAGEAQTHSLRAGQHFSEWAWECPDVNPVIKHERAVVFANHTTVRRSVYCQAHDYVALLPLEAVQDIKKITLRWTGPPAAFALNKITLIDDEARVSEPVSPVATFLSDTSRWRYAGSIDYGNSGYGTQVRPEDVGASHIYENSRALPRAWLVSELLQLGPEETLGAIRTSKLPDGRTLDLARVAMLEESPPSLAPDSDPNASTRLRSLSATVMEVETSAKSTSFLVTSDVYYPGWIATVDGVRTRIYQTDYLLRGVALPAGNHIVRFEFRPQSFYVGGSLSIISLLVLIGMCLLRSSGSNQQGDQKDQGSG